MCKDSEARTRKLVGSETEIEKSDLRPQLLADEAGRVSELQY